MLSGNQSSGRPALPPAREDELSCRPGLLDARRAYLLLECAQLLHANLELPAVMEALAERVRSLLCARLVMVMLGRESGFLLEAVAAESAELAATVRLSEERGHCQFALDIARQAIAAGKPVILPVRGGEPDVPGFLADCEVLATPLQPAGLKPAALLVYCGSDCSFLEEEKSLLAAVSGMAALAMSNASLYAAAERQARDAQQLMKVVLELNSFVGLQDVLLGFVERAAAMLGARGAALALEYGGRFEVRALRAEGAESNATLAHKLAVALGNAMQGQTAEVVSGAATELLGDVAAELDWSTVTLARMRDTSGEALAVLCLADRPHAEIDSEVMSTLLAHASVALENARQFRRMHDANRHWIEVFDAISDFILVHDDSYRVLRVNRALADFIGVPPQELIGITTQALMSMASDAPARQCPFCSDAAEDKDRYLHPEFDRTYLVSTSHIAAERHEGTQTIHVLKDITDRQEAERRYRELFDTIQEGLFFSTPEGRFIEVNDALVRMLGYGSREELLQCDIARQVYVSPEQREHFTREIETKGVLRNYEEVLRRKDGSVIHSLQNAFAVRDAQGRVVQYRGLMLDITEQKNFQAELQRQRDFNSKILNNTQSMILVLDAAGFISYANRRCFEAGGYRQDDLIGRKLVDLVPPGRRQALNDALTGTFAGRQVDNLELPILLGQGRGGQFSVNLSPMRDESGHVDSLVVVMTDITDAAMLQAKLTHTEKMAAVGQLVSGVAHEVNNPLTAILGFSDLLLEQPEMPEWARKDLRVIMQEAQRTKQIVQNLLSFARQMPPQRSALQLNEIVRRTLALRNYDFSSHGVQIIERLDERLPHVVGDSHQLQQVFLNILNNAYDAVSETNRTGRIEVSTSLAADSFVEVSFRDNGDGILYPDLIFDPFFTTKEVGKGTGLGLSICYGIVREHGGEITCRNNPDAGATFTVRLPTLAAAYVGAAVRHRAGGEEAEPQPNREGAVSTGGNS